MNIHRIANSGAETKIDSPCIQWCCKYFDKLTLVELYSICQLRSEVFVVEQNCLFLDLDNKDQVAHHLLGQQSGKLIAYARLLAPGVVFTEMSIGRVVTSAKHRGSGAGRALMLQAIDHCYRLFGTEDIKIGAQLYLQKFYESVGFNASGPVYLEDHIEHVEMIKVPYSKNSIIAA